jgi:dihydroorotase/N-acyl-D-amino-acid deacylase
MTIDTLIIGARVVDGTGNPWRYGDVAISGDRVLEVAPPNAMQIANARVVIDAEGMVVCPGFIDIQSHSILPLMADGRCLSKIMQGVTTEIMGEAWTPAPFGGRIDQPMPQGPVYPAFAQRMAEWKRRAVGWRRFGDWLEALGDAGVSPNVGSFLGGGTLRQFAKGMEMGPATADDLATMRRVAEDAMADGAFGVSYALIYPPDAFASTAELVELCKVVAQRQGIYITHIRSEADTLGEALDEALEIAKRADVPAEIYHLKAAGKANWSKMHDVIATINRARASGIDVTADMYPYVAAGTGLSSVLPPWVAADGKFFDNLRDPAVRAIVREEVLHPRGGWEALAAQAGPDGVMPVGFQKPELRRYTGKRLTEIAADMGKHWVDAAIDLLLAEEQRISTIYFLMDEENLVMQLQQPWIKISTDAGGIDPAWAVEAGPIHPRAYGTFPRLLAKYVREEQVITLEDAVRKMSSAVAARLGLRDRGLLRAGAFADVVIFEPETIVDRATFESPHQLAQGIRDVWVNGVRVVAKGVHTGATPGKVVRLSS